MKNIGTKLTQNEKFLSQEDFYKNLVRKLNAVRSKVELGGGEKSIERHHDKGKLTARERIAELIDENPFFLK